MFRPKSENTVLCWELIFGDDLKVWRKYTLSGLTFNVKSDLGLRVVEQIASEKF